MTKLEMVNYIEKSGMVINFNHNRFMRMLKERVEDYYNRAVQYSNR